MNKPGEHVVAVSLDARHPLDRSLTDRAPMVPSWGGSLLLHAVLLFLFAMTLKDCGPGGVVGLGDADYREVGIYLKSPALDLTNEQPTAKPDPAAEQPPVENTILDQRQQNSVDSEMSHLLDLPKIETAAVIGPGVPALADVPSQADDLTTTPGANASVPNRAAGQGETSFFDIKAHGTRFVYVLDRSGSMDSYHAILFAKAELIGSLQSLEATQQFQIIFYNMTAREMTSRNGRSQLLWATDINRTLARQFIAGIHSDGGTNHLPALRKALRFNPEHLFFLTDADQPQMSAADLDEIRRLNHGRTHIHCVEFGKGPDVPADNFLKRLARQNGGSYRYCDVTQFVQRAK